MIFPHEGVRERERDRTKDNFIRTRNMTEMYTQDHRIFQPYFLSHTSLHSDPSLNFSQFLF